MVGVVFHFKEAWRSDYYLNGIRAEGLVLVQKREDVAVGYVTYCVLVSNADGHEAKKQRWREWLFVKKKQGHYCLTAATRFEKGDVIAMSREGEGREADKGDSKRQVEEPCNENIGMGLQWAEYIQLTGDKKTMKRCNAIFGSDGFSLRASTRILPGGEIVVGEGRFFAEYDDTWKDLRWLDALVYDGTVGAGKVAIGHVLKFNKTTDRYLIRFDDGRVVSMEEEEVQRKVLTTKEI
jgi:hypothetical protein